MAQASSPLSRRRWPGSEGIDRLAVPDACFGLLSVSVDAPNLVDQKDDKRIIKEKDVAEGLETEANLAAIPWDDFEHLVRQLFEWEFGRNGVEVKVTRASRDRGVDAIMLDPDPLRGGNTKTRRPDSCCLRPSETSNCRNARKHNGISAPCSRADDGAHESTSPQASINMCSKRSVTHARSMLRQLETFMARSLTKGRIGEYLLLLAPMLMTLPRTNLCLSLMDRT